MEENVTENIVIPEVPKVIPGEQLFVYVPVAEENRAGIVSVDKQLSKDSSNPVENKVIKQALDKKLDESAIDSKLSSDSTNPVENKVIVKALEEKQDKLVSTVNIKTINNIPLLGSGNIDIEGSGSGGIIAVDGELSDTSPNPVENRVITKALNDKQDKLTFDTTPSRGSKNPVTSDGIVNALDNVRAIAMNKNSAIVSNTYNALSNISELVARLTSIYVTYSTYKIGDVAYIVDLNVPDFWIGAVSSTKNSYFYTSDEDFIEASKTGVHVGYYILYPLETQKVDLTVKQNKPVAETITISSWTELADGNSPYTHGAIATVSTAIGENATIELINNNPVLFAKHGFAIAAVFGGQDVSIFSIGQPTESVTLTVEVTN